MTSREGDGGRGRGNRLLALVLVALMVGSAVAAGAVGSVAAGGEAIESGSASEPGDASESGDASRYGGEVKAVDTGPPVSPVALPTIPGRAAGSGADALTAQQESAAEQGVQQAVELVEAEGGEVSDDAVEAATAGATAAAAQYQEASAEQVQAAAKGAAHGAFVQEQVANVSQVQVAVGGAATGALSQSQEADVSQLQSAAYGAAHGSLAQRQDVTVEQIQFAASGSAAGAAAGAAVEEVDAIGKIREAAQGGSYGALQEQRASAQQVQAAAIGGARGALVQHQSANVKQVQVAAIGGAHGSLAQRQQVTVEQVQAAALGGSAGSLVQVQRVTVEQIQIAAKGAAHGAITKVVQVQEIQVEQVQLAARGAAAGSLSQRQSVKVEQVQAAAKGAAGGAVLQHQSATVEQVQVAARGAATGALVQRQTVNVQQIQRAAQGAATGALVQAQDVRVEQVQAAAQGAASGVTAQRQVVSVEQAQSAAQGAAQGAIGRVVQSQEIRVEQVQAAAHGAAGGVISQRQTITVEQVQAAASGAAGGALLQYQRVTVEQIQVAARGASAGSASAIVQRQTVTVEQVQAAAGGAAEGALTQIQRVSVSQIQYAAQGAAEGALVQRQTVTVEQIQAAALGAASGGVQVQQVTIVQVQTATRGAASGALAQAQTVTVEQIQGAANGACRGVLRQVQRTTVTQIQYLTWETAASTALQASQEGINDPGDVSEIGEGIGGEHATDPDPQPTASVRIDDQQVEDGTVTVESVDLSEGGFVVVHDTTYDQSDLLGSIVGVSAYLEPGEHEDVTVELDEPLPDDQTVFAVAYRDTNDDESFDFAASRGAQDAPYLGDAGPVLDRASVTVPPEPGTANVSVEDQTSDGTAVEVAAANLSDGGFLGVHDGSFDYESPGDSLVGATDYLEPGEQGSVTVELDDPLNESGPVYVVPYRDTNDNEAFDYVASDGEQDRQYTADGTTVFASAELTVENDTDGNVTPNASLSVADQTGNGTALAVENASATVDYRLTASTANETLNETTLAANETFEGDLTLDPALTENATVSVAVVDAETGDELVSEDVSYTVEPAPEPAPNATLDAADQTGEGTNLTVDDASATVDYRLTASAANETLNETTLAANESFTGNLTLEPPLTENATVTVSVLDAETDDELATEDVAYTVTNVTENVTPNATLDVTDQSGDGANLTVESASATVDSLLTATAANETLNETALSVNETFEGNLTLDPALTENATVTVAVEDAETGDELATEDVAYTVTNVTDDNVTPNATLDVADQTGTGANLTVENASATVEYVVQADTAEQTVNQTDVFEAGEAFAGNLTLDPALTENATVAVRVLDAETGDELATDSVAYTVVNVTDDDNVTDGNVTDDNVTDDNVTDDNVTDGNVTDDNVTDDVTPSATLDVPDQTGEGVNLTVDNASAAVDYTLVARADGETLAETATIPGNTSVFGNLTLTPPLTEDATVTVAVVDAETGDELVSEDVAYTVADGTDDADENVTEPEDDATNDTNVTEPEDDAANDTENVTEDGVADDGAPSATLEVADQTGEGVNLTVDDASAAVDYTLVVRADDETLAETAPIQANTSVFGNLTLTPPLTEDATVTVAVLDAETGEELVSEDVAYTVVDETDEADENITDETDENVTDENVTEPDDDTDVTEPEENVTDDDVAEENVTDDGEVTATATLDVADQTGDGVNFTVEDATANVDYRIVAEANGLPLNETTLAANETFEGNLSLDPTLDADATVTVRVEDAVTGEELAVEDVSYEVVVEPDATVSFDGQESDGETVVVESAFLPDGGFVVVHDADLETGDAVGSVVGNSTYLEPGEHRNVEVELEEPLTTDATLYVMPHRDANANETFDFVNTSGVEDGPYEVDGQPVVDDAFVTVPTQEPTTNDTPTEPNETEPPTEPSADGNVSDGNVTDGNVTNGNTTDGNVSLPAGR